MAKRRPRSGGGPAKPPSQAKASQPKAAKTKSEADTGAAKPLVTTPAVKVAEVEAPQAKAPHTKAERPSTSRGIVTQTRTRRLRLVHIDPWSVMRMTFLLSIIVGIAVVVAVFVLWLILSGTGVWSSINSSVRNTIGNTTTVPFNITDYLGLGRVVGFTMVTAVVETILVTAVATLGSFLYNLAANLLGGVEATYAEEY